MSSIVFIAPGNSIHSFKWISSISKFYDGDIYWISFFGNEYSIPGVKQIVFKKNIKGIINSIFFIKKNIKAIIHIHSLGFHLLFFIFFIFFLLKNKIICTPWGSDLIYGRLNPIKKLLLTKIFKSSALITCDAFFMKKLIKKIYPLAKVKLIYFGIDTDKFIFQKRKIFKKKLKLLSIRNLEEIYNVESIIKMVEIVTRKGLDVKLSIYGDGSLREQLKKLVYDKSLNNKISFLGRYSQKNLVNILAQHDLYISMARSDAGIASSTAEAMSTGMICLISDVAENSLWISHKVSGFLIKNNDSNDLAKNVELIINGKINIKNLGINARKKIKNFNSIYKEMKKMSRIYKFIES